MTTTNEFDLGKIGRRFIFDYPTEFVTLPEYTARAGSVATVIRPLTPDEAEPPSEDIEGMWLVKTDDGWEGHAFDSEVSRPA